MGLFSFLSNYDNKKSLKQIEIVIDTVDNVSPNSFE